MVWMSLRARIFVYHEDRVSEKELEGYLSLMNDNWKSRLLVRSSNNVYNQSLISAMIHNYGKKQTRNFLINFTRKLLLGILLCGDRDQIRGVVSGEGDLAIVNSYYFIKMKKDDKKGYLKKLNFIFPMMMK